MLGRLRHSGSHLVKVARLAYACPEYYWVSCHACEHVRVWDESAVKWALTGSLGCRVLTVASWVVVSEAMTRDPPLVKAFIAVPRGGVIRGNDFRRISREEFERHARRR